MNIFKYVFFIAFVIIFFSSHLLAYETNKTAGGTDIKWDTSSATFMINTSGGPSNSLSAIQAGLQTWSNVSNSTFNFVYSGTTSSTAHGTYDGVNIITFGELSSHETLAVNNFWYNSFNGVGLDSDIRFNTKKSWGTSGDPGVYDVQNIATVDY